MTANQRLSGSDRVHLLTVEEAAEVLNEHPKTIYRRVSAGELPWVNIAPAGKRAKIRFRQDQLNDFISDNGHPITAGTRRRVA